MFTKKYQKYGIWDCEGAIPFWVSTDNADGSFIQPINHSEVIQIPTKRLDSFINEPIKLLKIEAEGGEPEVIYGCEQLLRRISFISVDLGRERGINQEHTIVEVTNFLLKHDFALLKFIAPSGRFTALFKNNLT